MTWLGNVEPDRPHGIDREAVADLERPAELLDVGLRAVVPALFALSPRGAAEIIDISNAPFSLPDLGGVLMGITFIQNCDYAPGGTLA